MQVRSSILERDVAAVTNTSTVHRYFPMGKPKIRPTQRRHRKSGSSVKLLCATWNMEYLEFKTSDLIPDPKTGRITIPTVRSYDPTSSNPKKSDTRNTQTTAKPKKSVLRDLLPKNYDIYVLCLQEVKRPKSFIKAACHELNISLGADELKLTGGYVLIESNRILGLGGYGDGAFLTKKMTTLSILVRKVLLTSKLLKIGPVVKATIAEIKGGAGSKGAVGQVLYLNGESLLVISSHLPSKCPAARFLARDTIRERLLEELAQTGFQVLSIAPLLAMNGRRNSMDEECTSSEGSYDYAPVENQIVGDVLPLLRNRKARESTHKLGDVIHNVIWAGDFNFRLFPDPTRADELIQCTLDGYEDGGAPRLHRYDEVNAHKYVEMADQPEFDEFPEKHLVRDCQEHFREELITFPPTYKKYPGRTVDPEQSILSEYVFEFKKRWYKGLSIKGPKNRNKESYPSWCDRVFYSSRTKNMRALPNTYNSVRPQNCHSPLLLSDHDPVICGFEIGLSPPEYFMVDKHEAFQKIHISSLVEVDRLSPPPEARVTTRQGSIGLKKRLGEKAIPKPQRSDTVKGDVVILPSITKRQEKMNSKRPDPTKRAVTQLD